MRLAKGPALAAAVIFTGCDGTPRESQPFAVTQMFGEVGGSPGQFLYPRAMAADPGSGQLWVIDKAGRIQRFDPASGRATMHFSTPEIALGRPCGITVGPGWKGQKRAEAPAGTDSPLLYVADTHYHRILIYDPDPARQPTSAATAIEPIYEFGRFGEGPGEFIYVTDVALLTDDQGNALRAYIGEYGGNDRISIWEVQDGEWRFVRSFGALGSDRAADNVEFDRPQSLAIDQKRRWLVVTDACNHRVGVFTLEGDLIRWIGSEPAWRSGQELPALGEPALAYPFGLHLLGDGSALVSEYGNHRVTHLDLEQGTVLGLYGTGGRAPGHLLNPWAVTMLNGSVYVLDSGNERVQAFNLPRRWRIAGGSP